MEKLAIFTKTYKLHILVVLLVIFFFRSCGRGNEISRIEKKLKQTSQLVDSLNTIIDSQNNESEKFHVMLKKEKLSVHMEYDYWISSKDRGSQLMELHSIVKRNIKDLEK